MKNVFEKGIPQRLEDMLEARENRSQFQKSLMQRFPDATLLALKINVPGPVKNNEAIQNIFCETTQRLEDTLKQASMAVLEKVIRDLASGPELFLVVNVKAKALKECTLYVEQSFCLGPLIDMDVFQVQAGQLSDISRTSLGVAPRKCFVCKEEAKNCARNRTHSLEEVQREISTLYFTFFDE